MENPIKTDDLEVPLFLETPIWENIFWKIEPANPSLRAYNPPSPRQKKGQGCFSVAEETHVII